MAYEIVKSNGDPIEIADGAVDNSQLSIGLIGQNFVGFGGELWTGIVHMLENFSNGIEPANPTTGQLWYDSANNLLKIYNGTFDELKLSQLDDVESRVILLEADVSVAVAASIADLEADKITQDAAIAILEADKITQDAAIAAQDIDIADLLARIIVLEAFHP